jgi:aminoglycoside phosphotransferase (APT) family kinase protein
MALSPPATTRVPREAHRLDEAKLGAWIGAHVEGCRGGEATVRAFKGGQSNPTYWVGMNDVALVVRKKPPGVLLPSAHAIEREYRIMRALRTTAVPVPDALALCEDPDVIGTPFFVMRWVPGRIFWDPAVPDLTREERAALYREYVRVLAALHTVDVNAVGLADYGKPAGFVPRQLDRWTKQFEASRTGPSPAMDELVKWLHAHLPKTDESTIIHGDYRIDNVMFEADGTRAVALLDWELSTLGHPLSDLAYACLAYHMNLPGRGGLVGVDFDAAGIPTENELIAEYLAQTGRQQIESWPFFLSFGIFRLAAIAQGVYARSLQGNAASEEAGQYGSAVALLAEIALGIARAV